MAEPRLTVLFDEACGFCRQLARWLERRATIAIEPIGSPTGARLLRDLPPARRYDAVHIVEPRGRRFSGAEALPPLLRTLPRLAWAAPIVEALPRPTAWAYGVVARHRGLLSRLLRLRACSAAAAGRAVEQTTQGRHSPVPHPRAPSR